MRDTAPAPPPARRRVRQTLAWLAAAIVAIVALLALLLALVLYTEWGARMAWQAAAKALPGQLSGEVVGGTLADGLALRNVAYEDATRKVSIDRLDAAWRLRRSPLLLTVPYLRLGKVDLTLLPDPKPPEPATLPREIRLPLAIDLQSATIERLLVHKATAAQRFGGILLRAESDGVRHRVNLERAETPFGNASAALRLNGLPPFALGGSGRLDGGFRGHAVRLDAQLSGTLGEPGIRLEASGADMTASAHILATPFAQVPLRRAEVQARHVNPQAFNEGWPRADLAIDAELAPAGDPSGGALTVAGPVSLSNARPGAIDRKLLPLAVARADVVLDAMRQQINGLTVTLAGDASVTGSGELRDAGRGELTLQTKDLDLSKIHSALRKTRLAGPLNVKLLGDTQEIDMRLAGKDLSIAAGAVLDPQQIRLNTATLAAGDARLDLSGTLGRADESAYVLTGSLSAFNPARFLAAKSAPRNKRMTRKLPDAHINMQFKAHGALRPAFRTEAAFQVRDSSYAGLPMTGGGTVRVEGRRILPSDAQLSVAGNRASLKGSFGGTSGALSVVIDAPALDRLGVGLSGRLQVDGRIAGTPDRPVLDAAYRAEEFAFGQYRIARLSGETEIDGLPGSAPDARVMLELDARGLQGPDASLSQLRAGIDGTYASHTIDLTAEGRLRGRPVDAALAAQGCLHESPDGMAWEGVLRKFENAGFPRLSMAAPLSLAVAPGRIALGATRLMVEGASVELESFRYTEGAIRSEGAFRTLEIAHLLELRRQLTGATPPVRTDLVLDGSWNLTLAESASGFAHFERRSGDIALPQGGGRNRIGLNALSVRADLKGNAVALTLNADAARIGSLNGQGWISLSQTDGRLAVSPDAPVSGSVAARIPRLQALGFLIGPDIALGGSLTADLAVGGTLADPRLTGTAAGDGLALTLYEQGIRLRDGTARLALQGDFVELQRLEFHSGGGTLRASGRLPLVRPAENLRAALVADKFQLLSDPSSQMTLSGRAEANTVDGQTQVTGQFVVDRALFSLPEKAPPKLGDDVVVIREGQRQGTGEPEGDIVPTGKQPPGPFSPRVNIQVGLGDDFRFEGSGAELRLAGTLTVRSAPGASPQAFGTIRVVDGTYEAFGAELAIERGVINFQGPMQNPNVNILAMRRGQEVAAGVQVTGTVQRPRVQIVSEPNVPDEEKLSWLVFGHSGGGSAGPGQAQAAAKGAALGLLNKFGGERLAKGFGLDELSIGESAFGLTGQQVVNLGKEISDRLFIGYEQSLASAESVLKLTYELTRNWSVVLRGGYVTGVEVFFSKRFDGLR